MLRILLLISAALIAGLEPAWAEEPEPDSSSGALSLPYAFYEQSFGLGAGWVQGQVGFPQPQAAVLGTAMAGTEGTGLVVLMGRDILTPWSERLFVDPVFSFGYFDDVDSYSTGNPNFVGQQPGSNNSDSDNFVSGSGVDTFARIRLKYLLPIGHGANQTIPDYTLDSGFLVDGATGATSWNPFESGRSFLELRPFYRSQQIDGQFVDETLETNGIDFTYFWDNRNFPFNPTAGNALTLKLSRDFGAFDSSQSWTVLQAEADAYHDFGSTDLFRSQVIAFDVWTADTPSWENNGATIDHRAPPYTGATLGGIWRMKAFPTNRFNDRSAIYYALELRLTPHWNPFDSWPAAKQLLGVEWLQVVPFVEAGRVADSYDLSELHTNMQWDAGLGVRAWAKGFVVRVDTAASNEGVGIQMMIGHPFQF